MLSQRKRVDLLTAPEADRLKSAFARLEASADPTANYAFWASIHANHCPHRSQLFLPWHRAYIFAFEDALRAAAGDETLTLPYWDWVKTPGVPPIFQQPPLDALRYSADERRQRNLHLPSPHQVESVLGNPYFVYFGGTRCDGTMANGSLEDIHGLVHTWVGPVMKERSTAAYDPIFWFHHANVDRLWAIWQSSHSTGPTCLAHPLEGIPGDWHVSDVLDPAAPRLGYEYLEVTIAADGSEGEHVRTFDILLPLDSRVELRLTNIVLTGEGEAPAFVAVYIGDAAVPVGYVSLFGSGADMPGSAGAHMAAHHHAHGTLEARFDVTDVVRRLIGQKLQMRLAVGGLITKGPVQRLSISDISLAAVDAR